MIDTVVLDPDRHVPGARRHPRPADTLRAEWLKFWSVRSTGWSTAMLFVLGAGLTTLVCATSATWLASGEADESPASFITWGLFFAQITALAHPGKNAIGTARPPSTPLTTACTDSSPRQSSSQNATRFKRNRIAKLTRTASSTLSANAIQSRADPGNVRSKKATPTSSGTVNRVSSAKPARPTSSASSAACRATSGERCS